MVIKAFVPIKLNSERLEGKMLLPLGNKLVFQYIFDTLIDVKKEIDIDIYCFCSDEKIIDLLPREIIFLKRDKTLDMNHVKGMDIYKSFTEKIKSDIYILCHATSPFIKSESIIKGLKKVLNENYDSAFSCNKIKTFCWYKNKPLNYKLDDIIKTQDIEPIYNETSAFYIFTNNVIKNNRRIGDKYCIIETNNEESIDIDELKDYELAKKICV